MQIAITTSQADPVPLQNYSAKLVQQNQQLMKDSAYAQRLHIEPQGEGEQHGEALRPNGEDRRSYGACERNERQLR
jgi:hypothetical protein